MRMGRLSNDEIEYINNNFPKLDYRTIAVNLDRDQYTIRAWIDRHIGLTPGRNGINELKKKAYWPELKNQFTTEELEMFQYHWGQMWQQFKDDVFHTEEMQIVDTIKLEILMNRALRAQSDNVQQVANLDKEIEKRRRQAGKVTDLEEREATWKEILNLERQKAVLEAGREAISRDFKDLQTKKASLIKDLKGTREQRIKAIEDSKQTFGALLKKIITDSEFRKSVGREMEKMRLATEKELKRLSEPHIYSDGVKDQPILTADTMIDVYVE